MTDTKLPEPIAFTMNLVPDDGVTVGEVAALFETSIVNLVLQKNRPSSFPKPRAHFLAR